MTGAIPGLPISVEEYFSQDEWYWSESKQERIQIKKCPCPVAMRALAKIERTLGYEALESPLAQALKARAEQGIGAELVEFDGPTGPRMMLRDKETKTFRAGASRI
jgi:hypothetical protein